MASLQLQGIVKRYGDDDGHPRHRPRSARRRVRRLRGAVRVRQVDAPAHDRGTGIGERRRTADRWQAGERGFRRAARPRHGVPVIRALSAHDRVPEPGLRTGEPAHAARRHRRQGAGCGAHAAPRTAARAPADPALGRPATARRDRPRDRARSDDLPVRRAAVEPRRRTCACRCGRKSPGCTSGWARP